MIPQVVTNEIVTVILPNGVYFFQTDKPQPTHKLQGNLKKHLKAEMKVIVGKEIAQKDYCVLIPDLQRGCLRGMNEKTCCSFQVEGSLITNILSILFAFMGIVILSVSLAGVHPASEQCEQSKLFRPAEQYYYHRPLDNNDCSSTKAVLTGVLSLMLICSVLELGLTVLAAMLWWKQGHQGHSDFSHNVIFLSCNSNNESNMESK
uniref:membrane-spanning 4-domains subfamily A member 6B-like n=1 Tax=Myodes glareolus TaxID=447135 RepID=UPI0020221BD0|nr:membrane-spanning 4-domains subfamily A member 6B-like [Myodes glareolus]